MKRITALLLALAMCLSLCACGAEKSVPKVEETVPESVAATEPVYEPAWVVDYFVDDFGDTTDKAYIKCLMKGDFSNTATMDSNLDVVLFCNPYVANPDVGASFAFRLLEYGNHPATYLSGDDIVLKIKIGDAISTCELTGDAPNGDLVLLINEESSVYNKIHETLARGEQNIRCIIEIGSSKYNFTIPCETYADACNEMMRAYGYDQFDVRLTLGD